MDNRRQRKHIHRVRIAQHNTERWDRPPILLAVWYPFDKTLGRKRNPSVFLQPIGQDRPALSRAIQLRTQEGTNQRSISCVAQMP